ncbi:MAG: hypothetical protein V5A64_04245 [Candidatus Thermoplasmatota archaeon]
MNSEKKDYYKSLEEYQRAESMFHTELMNVCKKYVSKLSTVSLIGVIETVKEETRELEKATKRDIDKDETGDKEEFTEANYF